MQRKTVQKANSTKRIQKGNDRSSRQVEMDMSTNICSGFGIPMAEPRITTIRNLDELGTLSIPQAFSRCKIADSVHSESFWPFSPGQVAFVATNAPTCSHICVGLRPCRLQWLFATLNFQSSPLDQPPWTQTSPWLPRIWNEITQGPA